MEVEKVKVVRFIYYCLLVEANPCSGLAAGEFDLSIWPIFPEDRLSVNPNASAAGRIQGQRISS